MTSQQESEDDGVDLIFAIQPDEEGTMSTNVDAAAASHSQLQQHHLPSTGTTLVIQQLPSQGLSFQLWPAATTLFKLLDRHRHDRATSPLSAAFPESRGRRLRVLELGSGTGLVGIAAAAALGADVTVTDLPHVLENLRFNTEANSNAVALQGGSVSVAPLRWGEVEDFEAIGRDFDLILGSDVVYYDHLYAPLLQTLRYLLGGDGNVVFVMAHLRRWKKEAAFFKKAKKLFEFGRIHVDDPSPGSRLGVVAYSFSKKGHVVRNC